MMSSNGWNSLLPSLEDGEEQSKGTTKKTMSIGVAMASSAALEMVPCAFLLSL
jgi:hypothetical protein